MRQEYNTYKEAYYYPWAEGNSGITLPRSTNTKLLKEIHISMRFKYREDKIRGVVNTMNTFKYLNMELNNWYKAWSEIVFTKYIWWLFLDDTIFIFFCFHINMLLCFLNVFQGVWYICIFTNKIILGLKISLWYSLSKLSLGT